MLDEPEKWATRQNNSIAIVVTLQARRVPDGIKLPCAQDGGRLSQRVQSYCLDFKADLRRPSLDRAPRNEMVLHLATAENGDC
jgi:hypothetical protein